VEGAEISVGKTVAVTVEKGKRMPTLTKKFKVKINEKLCKGCYFCVKFCPMGVFVRSDVIGELGYNIAEVEFPEKCTGCKACLLYCPDLAVAIEEEKGSKSAAV
jgi:2-oxoglutarate ferredoxin oxidoreductase subunit delta